VRKRVELPLVEPLYQTYHNQGAATAILKENPSIRNWYLNQIMKLMCNTKFLQGFTSPEINVLNSSCLRNPYIERHWFTFRHTQGYIHPIIRELINDDFYVTFNCVDDYYVKGKTWYKERHFSHDGLICGYDQADKTYCMYAYDSNWIYQKFWTPQRCFNAGRLAIQKENTLGGICGLKPKIDQVAFLPEIVHEHLLKYLNSSIGEHPRTGEETVYGINVHEYIARYIGLLMDGSIPYEKMDRRVFRMIWEHKKVMLERILKTEEVLRWDSAFSERYRPLVESADLMRMLYASHHMKRRDSVLPIIQKKLLVVHEQEKQILTDFTEKLGKELNV